MNTSDVLNKAADILQVRGWTNEATGAWFPDPDAATPVCAEGAIRLALGKNIHLKPAICGAVGHYLIDSYPHMQRSAVHGGVIVFAWNDAPGRTADEVVEVLRATALIEASRERETAEVASC